MTMTHSVKTKVGKLLTGGVVLGLALTGTLETVQAQPDMNDAPKADNPAPQNGGRGGGGGNRPDFRNMTPEQREAWTKQRELQMQQFRAENTRRSLERAGFT